MALDKRLGDTETLVSSRWEVMLKDKSSMAAISPILEDGLLFTLLVSVALLHALPTIVNPDLYQPLTEGYKDSCSNQFITNNEIGPCGTSPNTAKQFRVVMTQLREFMATPKRLLRKRQTQAPGQWADGISLACRNSTVTGNTITGATE